MTELSPTDEAVVQSTHSWTNTAAFWPAMAAICIIAFGLTVFIARLTRHKMRQKELKHRWEIVNKWQVIVLGSATHPKAMSRRMGNLMQILGAVVILGEVGMLIQNLRAGRLDAPTVLPSIVMMSIGAGIVSFVSWYNNDPAA